MNHISSLCFAYSRILKYLAKYSSSSFTQTHPNCHHQPRETGEACEPQPLFTGDRPRQSIVTPRLRIQSNAASQTKKFSPSRPSKDRFLTILTAPSLSLGSFLPPRLSCAADITFQSALPLTAPPAGTHPLPHPGSRWLPLTRSVSSSLQGAPRRELRGPAAAIWAQDGTPRCETQRRCGGAGGELLAAASV